MAVHKLRESTNDKLAPDNRDFKGRTGFQFASDNVDDMYEFGDLVAKFEKIYRRNVPKYGNTTEGGLLMNRILHDLKSLEAGAYYLDYHMCKGPNDEPKKVFLKDDEE